MKVGDLVRFAKWEEFTSEQISKSNYWHLIPKSYFGILVEHDKLMKVAEVFYEGEVLKIRSVFVTKAGKKRS
jgi:hypothetical protein